MSWNILIDSAFCEWREHNKPHDHCCLEENFGNYCAQDTCPLAKQSLEALNKSPIAPAPVPPEAGCEHAVITCDLLPYRKRGNKICNGSKCPLAMSNTDVEP